MNLPSSDPFESYPIDDYDDSRLSPFLREVRQKALQRQRDREDCGLWDDEPEPMPAPLVTITGRTTSAEVGNASTRRDRWPSLASDMLRHADQTACAKMRMGIDRIEADPRRGNRGRAVLEATRAAVERKELELLCDEYLGEEGASS